MLQQFKIVLLRVSFLLVLAHHAVPHQHHATDGGLESFHHEEAQNWIEILEHALHIDMGEGHLETYKPANQTAFHGICADLAFLASPVFVFDMPYLSVKTTPFLADDSKLFFEGRHSSLNGRAPPRV